MGETYKAGKLPKSVTNNLQAVHENQRKEEAQLLPIWNKLGLHLGSAQMIICR